MTTLRKEPDARVIEIIEWCEERARAAAAVADGFDYHAGERFAYEQMAKRLRAEFPAAAKRA